MKLLESKPAISENEEESKSEIELKIDVTPEEFDAAINKSYLKNRSRIGVPGFRKGKAPRKIIEKMYGVAVFMQDAIDIMLPDVLRFALEETDFDIVGYPRMSDLDLLDNDTHAVVTLRCTLRPKVTLGKYKGLSAQKIDVEVSDEEVMNEIDKVRERNARLESVERPAKTGDIAVIDFEGFFDDVPFDGGKGENYELELGSGKFIPGFEDKLTGMEISEERDIEVTFPEDYGSKDHAGKTAVFKVKLHELKEKQLPALDDEFAMDVSEFDTLSEYKADIKKKIEDSRKAEIDEAFESLLLEQVVENMQVDVPEAMIEEQMEKSLNNLNRQISAYGMKPAQYMQMLGINQNEFKDRMRDNAEKQVRISLALEEIASVEKIEVTPDEIEEEYTRAAGEYKMEIGKFKETVGQDVIESEVKLRKAAKLITETAKPEKPAKADKPEKADKPAKADKPEKAGKNKED